MKNIHIILIALFTLVCTNFAFAQDKKQAEFEKMVELLKGQNFYFEAQRTSPQGGRTIDLTGDNYTLTIKGEEAEAFLPFFGRAFTPSYGSSEGGIKFKENMQDIDFKLKEKKYRIVLKFTVETTKDSYDCILDVSRSGFASLSINSQTRSTISFTGNVYQNEEKVQ